MCWTRRNNKASIIPPSPEATPVANVTSTKISRRGCLIAMSRCTFSILDLVSEGRIDSAHRLQGRHLGGNFLNNFSTLLSKFLMFFVELLERVLSAEPRQSNAFVFLSK